MHVAHSIIVALGGALALESPTMAQRAAPQVQVHGTSGDTMQPVQRSAEQIVFTPTKGKTGIASARVAGNPAEPGLYVVMVKMDQGAENAPHTHPDGRVTTVLRGRILYGLGTKIERSKTRIYEAGAYYYTPPSAPHYLISMAPDTLYQEVGVGPSASIPLAVK